MQTFAGASKVCVHVCVCGHCGGGGGGGETRLLP